MKTNFILIMLTVASTLIISCQKENTKTSSTAKKYEIKMTIDGKNYQYSYEKSGCDVDPAFCALPTGAGFAEYQNNLLGRNQIWYGTGFLGGLQAVLVENCTNNCFSVSIYLENWAVGTYNTGMVSMIASNELYVSQPGTTEPIKPITVRITQSGEIGSIIKGNFSGNIYKYTSSSINKLVSISGEFSAGRFN